MLETGRSLRFFSSARWLTFEGVLHAAMPAISAATAVSTSVGVFLANVDNFDSRMRASPRDQKRLVNTLLLTVAYMTHPLSNDLPSPPRPYTIISRTMSSWCHVALFQSLRLVAVAFISDSSNEQNIIEDELHEQSAANLCQFMLSIFTYKTSSIVRFRR